MKNLTKKIEQFLYSGHKLKHTIIATRRAAIFETCNSIGYQYPKWNNLAIVSLLVGSYNLYIQHFGIAIITCLISAMGLYQLIDTRKYKGRSMALFGAIMGITILLLNLEPT